MLYGSTDIEAAVKKAKSLGQPALALTDYGNLFNAVEFYRTCKAEDVKPIMGVDVFFCENAQEMRAHKIRQGYHLTLLAENNTGWKNLTGS
jgi:DNA polymerase-3 subunit alpha